MERYPFHNRISVGDKKYILLPAIGERSHILTRCEVIYLYNDACEVRVNFNKIYYRPFSQIYNSREEYLNANYLEEVK